GLAALTLAITLRYRALNRRLQAAPWLLVVDLALSAAAIALTGGVASPFYFHALSPILAAAFFFGIRGGIAAALAFTPMYLAAIFLLRSARAEPASSSLDLFLALTQIFTVYVIGLLFGYPAQLLARLREQAERLEVAGRQLAASNAELEHMNSQLRLIQALTLSLQSSVELTEMQQVLLTGLVEQMGFPAAAVALSDGQARLAGWMRLRRGETIARCLRSDGAEAGACVLPADGDAPLAAAVAAGELRWEATPTPPTGHPELDRWLDLRRGYVAAPLRLRGNLVGVLLVESEEAYDGPADPRLTPLALVIGHASVALGSLRLCIERAQRLAAEEARNRIAADIHDTVSQHLFGLAYGLNACNQLLAQQPQALDLVKAQLADLEPLAFAALHQMRSAILGLAPGGLDSKRLAAGLRKHLAALAMGRPIALEVQVTPAFDAWPLALRHELLLIAQEGVANIARHANAHHARLEIAQQNGGVAVTIEDDGVGFDPAQAAVVDGLGLDGMRRRVERLGGAFHAEAAPGSGVRLHIAIPLERVR
ncbi:MAG: sensor histidine kinase, partial [Caldilineales bacterium]|nr:sensor histidine kinase [Caldilineales bacterium]